MTPEYLEKVGIAPGSRAFFEAAVLSSIMIRPEWMNACDIASIDFESSDHRAIFETMAALHADGIPIDSLTVMEKSKVQAWKISQIVAVAPTSANLPWYLERLKQIALEAIRKNEGGQAAMKIKAGADPDKSLAEMNTKIKTAEDRLLPKDDQPEFARVISEIISRIRTGFQAVRTLRTGIPWLDSLSRGLIPGDYAILAARPSCGKTAMAVQILAELAHCGVPTVFFSREMSQELIAQRLISYYAWMDVTGLLRGESFTDQDVEQVLSAEIDIRKASNLIRVISRGITSIEAVEKMARQAVAWGAQLVVFDYIQLMEVSGGRSRNDEIERFSRRMKALLTELGVPGIFLSQLSRSCESENRRPKLSDLRDSGAIEQDADLVWFLHREKINPKDRRDDAPEQTVLIQAKGRNVGLGSRRLTFSGRFQRFSQLTGSEDSADDG